MPGRKFSASSLYRYGFNGKENDNEIKGEGNQQDYGLRIYDPRLVRFLSVDPLTASYPWYTPYQFAGNSPIANIDLDGGEPKPSTTGTTEGQTTSTSEKRYYSYGMAGAGGTGSYTATKTWNWHAGGLGTGKYKSERNSKGEIVAQTEILTQAGWYDSEGYLDVLASSSAAKQLAVDAGFSRWVYPGGGAKESLTKFVGEGLNENAANYLNAAAWKAGSKANFNASGYCEPSSFNVEDLLGIGLLTKAGFKALGSYAAKNISNRLAANAVLKNTVDDFVKLFKPINAEDVTTTLFRGTTGSEGKGNLLFLTNDASVAATYVKNGGQVMKYEVTNSSLFNLQQRGMLTINPKDMHMINGQQIYHTTYEFTGSNLRQALNQIAKPNQ